MVDALTTQGPNPKTPEGATAGSDADAAGTFTDLLEQFADPDGAEVYFAVSSEGNILGIGYGPNEIGIRGGYNQQEGWNFETNGEVTPKAEVGNRTFGGSIGFRGDIPGFDGRAGGGDLKLTVGGMEFEGRGRYDPETGVTTEVYQASLPDHMAKNLPESINNALDRLPPKVRDVLTKAGRGPAGFVADADIKVRFTRGITPEGEVKNLQPAIRLEVSPSELLSNDVADISKTKAIVELGLVFNNDELALTDSPELRATRGPQQPLDTHGILNPETRPGYVATVELAPGASVMVTADGRTVAGIETVRPETALALESVVRGVTAADYEAKAENTTDDAKRIENEAIAGAIRGGASIREAKNLGVDVRAVQSYHGDTRNADALIEDSRDNGFIDGSNLPEAKVGDETYAVSIGGGVMHGRTTMTPSELAARANAQSADPDAVDTDEVAKAMADAMAQSLREGFSARDQVAANDPASAAPGETAAAVRQELEAMVDDENGAELAGREQKAIEGLIDQARKIEEAAKFEGAKGLADSEYDVALQVQERDALDDMIAAANELEALADVPIPAFKPDQSGTERSDGPDMRGNKVAFGRGVVENGPSGKNVAYDSFSDAFADISDMFSGDPSKEGVAKPNEAEIEQQGATQKQEGGENKGQQNDIPEAGSEEDAAATSAEFDAMGKSTAGPDKDEKAEAKEKAEAREKAEAKEKAEKQKAEKEAEKKDKAQKHEGGENRGQQGPTESEKSEFGGSASDFGGSNGLL